jgi:hypothetical protein
MEHIGEIVQLALTLVAGGVMWQRLTDKADENRRRIERLEADSQSQRECIAELEAGVGIIQNNILWMRKRSGDSSGEDTENVRKHPR